MKRTSATGAKSDPGPLKIDLARARARPRSIFSAVGGVLALAAAAFFIVAN